MLNQVYTWKITCNKCARVEVFTVDHSQQELSYFGGNLPTLPTGWGRIEDPPPPPSPRPRGMGGSAGGLGGSMSAVWLEPIRMSTYREYCPDCLTAVIEANKEQKSRENHAEKYL